MKVIKYHKDFRDKWNDFLINSKNSTFLFNRNFLEYHADRFADHSLMVFNDSNKLVALLPANLDEKNVLVSHQGLTYGGLVIDQEERLNNVVLYFKEILFYLKSIGIEKLLYKELPSFYNKVPSDEHQYALFLVSAKLYRRDTAITINLNSKLPFQKRRSRSIKSAEKIGVVIKEQDSFEIFWDAVLTPNLLKRFNVRPVHSIEEINLLHNYFPNNIKQYNAYLDGEIMAGATIFETPTVAHAQYISATDDGRRNGSLDFLFCYLIENVYANKDYFDFGICNENNGRKLNQGLLDWKEGFGGRANTHNFYEVDTKNYIFLESFSV